MAIPADVPIVTCDARNRESTKQSLIRLVEYAMQWWMQKHPEEQGSLSATR